MVPLNSANNAFGVYLFVPYSGTNLFPCIQEIVNLPNNAFRRDVSSLNSLMNWPSSDIVFRSHRQCHRQNHSTNQIQLTGTRLSVVYKHRANKQIGGFIALPLSSFSFMKNQIPYITVAPQQVTSKRTQNDFGHSSRARDRNPLALLHWLTRMATYIATPQRKRKSSNSNSTPSTGRKTQKISKIKVQAHPHRWTTSSSFQMEWRI